MKLTNTTYQITLVAGGKPQVSVTSDDPQVVQGAIPWLAETYAVLRKEAKAVPTPATTIVQDQQAEEAPTCEAHQVPMVLVNGRKGPFWSCHEKNEDGTWCTYKPPLE